MSTLQLQLLGAPEQFPTMEAEEDAENTLNQLAVCLLLGYVVRQTEL